MKLVRFKNVKVGQKFMGIDFMSEEDGMIEFVKVKFHLRNGFLVNSECTAEGQIFHSSKDEVVGVDYGSDNLS